MVQGYFWVTLVRTWQARGNDSFVLVKLRI